jgi:hypothetical protein
MDAQPQTPGTRPRKIVCDACGLGPLDGPPLFTPTYKPGEPRRRFCPEHLPLDEVKRRLGRGPHTLDADVVAVFTRRMLDARERKLGASAATDAS